MFCQTIPNALLQHSKDLKCIGNPSCGIIFVYCGFGVVYEWFELEFGWAPSPKPILDHLEDLILLVGMCGGQVHECYY